VFGNGEGSPEQVRRLDATMLLVQQGAEVVGDEGDVGVVGAEQIFFDRQGLAVEPLGLSR
jgi:hypothetical protein